MDLIGIALQNGTTARDFKTVVYSDIQNRTSVFDYFVVGDYIIPIFGVTYILYIAACSYIFMNFIMRLKPGLDRLTYTIPIVALTIYIMLNLKYKGVWRVMGRFGLGFQFFWSCIKMIQAALHRGYPAHCQTSLQFYIYLSYPISPDVKEEHINYPKRSWRTFLVLNALSNTFLFLYFLEIESLPVIVRTYFLAIVIQTSVSLFDQKDFLDKAAQYTKMYFNRKFFEDPYKSQSLTELWNTRWNYYVGKWLRDVAYTPVIQGRWIGTGEVEDEIYQELKEGKRPKPNFYASSLAGILVFLLSGLMHQVPMWYVAGLGLSNLGQLYFFLAMIPLISAEKVVYKTLKKQGIQVPFLIKWAITQVAFLICAHYLFIGSIYDSISRSENIQSVIWDTNNDMYNYFGVNIMNSTDIFRNEVKSRAWNFY